MRGTVAAKVREAGPQNGGRLLCVPGKDRGCASIRGFQMVMWPQLLFRRIYLLSVCRVVWRGPNGQSRKNLRSD